MTVRQKWELEQLIKQNQETGNKMLNLYKQILLCEETDKDVKDVKSANKRKESQGTVTPEGA